MFMAHLVIFEWILSMNWRGSTGMPSWGSPGEMEELEKMSGSPYWVLSYLRGTCVLLVWYICLYRSVVVSL